MPKYRITSPDGVSYEVTAPDGATQEQVMAYVQSQHAPKEAYNDASGQFHNSVGRIPAPNWNAEGANPDQGNSGLQNFGLGVAKSVNDTYNGARQLGAMALDKIAPHQKSVGDLVTGQDNSRLASVNRDIAGAENADKRLMDTTGGWLGNAAGQTAQILAPIPGAAELKGAAMLGKAAKYAEAGYRAGVFGGLQATHGDESHLGNAAESGIIGVGGQAVPGLLGWGAKTVAPITDAAKQKALDTLQRVGVPVHLSQTMDSGFLKLVSSVANKLPFSGAQAVGRNQQAAFNKALGETMGLQGTTKLDENVMNTASRNIGKSYDVLFGRNTIKMTPQVMNNLQAVTQQAQADLTPDKAQIITNQIGKFLSKVDGQGQIPGRAYQQIRLGLRSLENNPETGYLVRQVRKTMEAAAQDSFGPADSAALKKLNERYANMRVIQKALGQVSGAGGDVKPASLWPLVNGKFGGTSDMRELARAGQLVLKDGIPDSGTAQRDQAYRLLGLGGAGAMTGVGLPLVAKGAAIGAVVGRALNSEAAAKAAPALSRAGSKALQAGATLTRPAPFVLPAALPLWWQQQNKP